MIALFAAAVAMYPSNPPQAKPLVVFISGDHEYGSEETLPIFAREFEKLAGVRTRVLTSSPDENGEEDIPGLEALDQADLAVFFLRWRRLPESQIAHIEKYLKSGKPVVGFRTSTHSFNYAKGHPLESWNRYAAEAFGAPPGWGADGHTHYGHESSTLVRITPGKAGHPIVKGLAPEFRVRSWLYQVKPKYPPNDAVPLLIGESINPDKACSENPVAWTWTNAWKSKVFFTTLGHPEDMALESVQRLVANGLCWALGKPSPTWNGRMPINVTYHGIRSTKP